MDRDSRRLSHNKGNKILTQVGIPLSSEGDNGDQRMVGSTLYIKSEGNWVAFESININRGNRKLGEYKFLESLGRLVNCRPWYRIYASWLYDR